MVQTRRLPASTGPLFAYLVIGCCGLLTGCGKKPEPRPEPAALPAAPPKPVVSLPPREPGLWQMTVAEEGSSEEPQILEICIDAETDRHLGILGTDLSGDRCQKTVSSKGAEGWDILAACDMGNGVSNEYSGAILGDYKSAYSLKLRSQTANASLPQMNRVANYTVDAKRMGDCPAGRAPGDVINDGVSFNLFDMAGLARQSSQSSDAPMHAD